MDLVVPREVEAFATVARQSFRSEEGLELHRLCAATSSNEDTVLALKSLDADDLDVLADEEQALAAVVLCREAGRAALPIALAAQMVGRALGLHAGAHAVDSTASADRYLIDYARMAEVGFLLDRSGAARPVARAADVGEPRPLAPWAAWSTGTGPGLELGSTGRRGWAWHEVLSAANSLGAMERAVELTKRHLNDREQFGRPLRDQQVLQHKYVDAVVELGRVRELLLFSAWRLTSNEGDPVGAADALRLVHLEALKIVFRHVHQLHGAIGFCYESDCAVLSRHVQFRRYQPYGLRTTRVRLAENLRDIPSLYGSPARAGVRA